MNTTILACYINNAFSIDPAEGTPDKHFADLRTSLGAAAATAAAAKKAVFAVKSHRPAYEAAIKLKGGERRRAIIAKQTALCNNYKVLRQTFAYYAAGAVESGKLIASCMSQMIANVRAHAVSSDTNRARRNNTVLCARVLKALPDMLIGLYEECKPDDNFMVAHDEIYNLHAGLFEHKERHLYAAPLAVPFIAGVSADESDMGLVQGMEELAAAKKEVLETFRLFMEVRSRALNLDHYRANLNALTDLSQAGVLVKEIEADVLSYETAFRAADAARYNLLQIERQCEEHMKALQQKAVFGSKKFSRHAVDVLKNNLIAARCALIDVETVLAKSRIHCDKIRIPDHALSSAAYKAMERALADVPAVFEDRFLDFLQ